VTQTTASVENPAKLKPVELWAGEIEAAEKELKKFYERGRLVTRKFLDERDALESNFKWFNIFYANTQILESALYAQLPKPAVSRKYTDYNDDIARVAALILERCITQDLDDPTDTFDPVMRHCVQDRLVPGLSQAWLRLETDTEELEVPPTPGNDVELSAEGDESAEGSLAPLKITDQRIVIDYIFWGDFLWSPCRIWEERRWVARKAYMTREELIERFGDVKGKACPLNFTVTTLGENTQASTPREDILKKAIVYEIWDRTTRKVFWYTKGLEELLDEKEDFLNLKGFEPCPRPMLANVSTSNTVPRPDYYMIQDQYQELDNINNRVSMLVSACKVVGVYDQAAIGVQRMLTEGFDNQLIPVDNWAMFAEKGGLKGTIDWLPLETVVQALQQLNAAREVIKGQIYELTGIADIVRGATKASETLGAQQIKAQFASVRIKKLQDEVARFAADLMRIKAELMVKHFAPEILLKKSNIMATGNDEWIGPALALLTTEEGFEWRITVNADTLAQADYAMEKQDRIEMLTTVSGYLEKSLPMMTQFPQSAALIVSIMKWAIAGFKNADEIEGMLDKELTALEQQAQQPKPPPPPSPEQERAQAEMQKMQAEQQADQQKMQMEMQQDQQKHDLEVQKLQMEMQLEQQRLQMELMAEKQRLALEMQQQQMELKFQMIMEQLKLQGAQNQAQLKLEAQDAQNQATLETQAQSAAIARTNGESRTAS
jgi:hypothetical protein